MKFVSKVLIFLFVIPIYCYKIFLSPFLGRQCNFYPTCSTYAIEAIKQYGIIKGGSKAFLRILKCNPFNKEFKHDKP